MSNIYYNNPNFSNNWGNVFGVRFQAAIFGEFGFGKFFSIVPEVAFSQQGFNIPIEYTDLNGNRIGMATEQVIYNHVNIPVLFRFSWKTSRLKLFVNTGPQLGMLTSANYSYMNRVYQYNLKYYNSPDFGWSLGGGIGYKLGPGWILTDLRYTHGLTNL